MLALQKLFLINILVLGVVATSSAQNRNGTYYRDDGRGDITFREVKRGNVNVLNFQISVLGSKKASCVGTFKGKAVWIDTNVAEFNSNYNETDNDTGETISCRLTFTFSGNRVIVREDDCGDYHGVSCNFEGTFARKQQKSKLK